MLIQKQYWNIVLVVGILSICVIFMIVSTGTVIYNVNQGSSKQMLERQK